MIRPVGQGAMPQGPLSSVHSELPGSCVLSSSVTFPAHLGFGETSVYLGFESQILNFHPRTAVCSDKKLSMGDKMEMESKGYADQHGLWAMGCL